MGHNWVSTHNIAKPGIVHSDVGDCMMLQNLSCVHFVGDLSVLTRRINSAIIIWNRSTISQSCHQDVSTPTSDTNIDVADNIIRTFLKKKKIFQRIKIICLVFSFFEWKFYDALNNNKVLSIDLNIHLKY